MGLLTSSPGFAGEQPQPWQHNPSAISDPSALRNCSSSTDGLAPHCCATYPEGSFTNAAREAGLLMRWLLKLDNANLDANGDDLPLNSVAAGMVPPICYSAGGHPHGVSDPAREKNGWQCEACQSDIPRDRLSRPDAPELAVMESTLPAEFDSPVNGRGERSRADTPSPSLLIPVANIPSYVGRVWKTA